jgi:hypothetical protein
MASLNTFGAILTHAVALESALRDYYQRGGRAEQAQAADKRRQTMERIRREAVVEITLEPIEGLDEADYALNLDDHSTAGRRAAEQIAARFYADAAPKINVRQAQRALERAGQAHQELADSVS